MSDQTNTHDTMTGSDESAKARDQAALALKSTVVDEAHHLTDGVKHLASDVAGQGRKLAESQLTSGKSTAAKQLGGVANALRKTGESLRAEDNDMFTDYLDTAAQKVDSAAGYLKTRSISDVVGDVEGFARREPALFLGGALVLGLLGGRFLKSTRPSLTVSAGGSQKSQRAAQSGAAKNQPKQQSASFDEDWNNLMAETDNERGGTHSNAKTSGHQGAKAKGTNGTKGHGDA